MTTRTTTAETTRQLGGQGAPAEVLRRTAVLGRGEVGWDEPVVGADDLGLGRGDGCFETLRVLGGSPPRVLALEAHLARFARSAALLDLPPLDTDGWTALARTLAADVPPGAEATLRLLLSRGLPGGEPVGIATLRPVPREATTARVEGVRVVTLPRGTSAHLHHEVPWLLGGAKTLSYAVHTAALREAVRRGAHDALFTSTEGQVLEGPTATLVWLADGELRTTPAEGSGILLGTTQEAVFAGARAAGVATAVVPATVDDVLAAEGAWLVSSVRGAVEITHLDGVELRRAPATTQRLREWAEA